MNISTYALAGAVANVLAEARAHDAEPGLGPAQPIDKLARQAELFAMPRLEEQRHFRQVQTLSFCYVCGEQLEPGRVSNRDHVPAQACFALADRNFPLLLPTHVECNGENKLDDEKLGQLIALRRSELPAVDKRRLRFRLLATPDGKRRFGGVNNLDVQAAVARWLRAFHAALYREALPKGSSFAIETPFPMATVKGSRVEFQPLRVEQHRLFVETLKQERAGLNIDRIRCYNGKVLYECVWDQFNDGSWLCVFGLDVHGWADLGDGRNFERRGCAGSYVLPSRGVPALATRAVRSVSAFRNQSPLDPFGD